MLENQVQLPALSELKPEQFLMRYVSPTLLDCSGYKKHSESCNANIANFFVESQSL